MSGPSVSGGGTIAVETDEMVRAAHRLAQARDAIDAVLARGAGRVAALTDPRRRGPAEEALELLHRASREAEAAADGLRIAAIRYGTVEHLVLDGQRSIAAAAAATTGVLMRMSFPVFGVAGPLLVTAAVLEVGGALVVVRTVQRTAETGRLAPQADPVLLRALALVLSSLDDGVRGALLLERPEDLLTDDPSAPFGLERFGAVLAALLLLRPAGSALRVVPTTRTAVRSPATLVDLVDRLPTGSGPEGQVRIERYDGVDGPRWIVYIAGTVTFARDSGDEPFDLASDVLGVAGRPSDSEQAVLQAMQQAGVGRDEPVLLVGHSQGALNAVRVAEGGGYRVGGVVGFGGPIGQIVLPADVPVLAVEHDEDLVPVLGAMPASGDAGLRRLVIRRSLPDGGFGVTTSPATVAFPAHDLGAYRRTTAQAEASGDPAVTGFVDRIGPFLDGGTGTATRWRARRVSSGPAPTEAGGTAPRSSR
jgi:hypothetical protein